MKIKFLVSRRFSEDSWVVKRAQAGDVLDVAENTARSLVADGSAEFFKDEEVAA